jgi:N-acetylmuramoyl-L-alanine amidase
MAGSAPSCKFELLRRSFLGAGASATFIAPALGRHAAKPAPRAKPAAPLPIVMLDPGHGGKDPGAIGVSGTYEKHIAFAAAEALRRLLIAGGKCRVVLSRAADQFIPLEDRVARAEAHGACLFVSMHADATGDHSVRGASVYTLGDAASDAQTAALAVRENAADRFGRHTYHDMPPHAAQVLVRLKRERTALASSRMASSVVSAFDETVPLLANPSRHAAFVVLRSVEIPSVLVEMGFMSNPQDEAALRRADHRAKVALAMQRAIEAYLGAANPASG